MSRNLLGFSGLLRKARPSINSSQLSCAITCGLGFYSPDLPTLGIQPPGAIDAFLPPEMSK